MGAARLLKNFFVKYRFLIGVAGLVILIDQLTKEWVRIALQFGEMWAPTPEIMNFARIVHWRNSGAAFGILDNFGGIFGVLAVVVGVAIFYYYPQLEAEDWLLRLALGLQLGGAFGNLIDRIFQGGYVTDFVSIGNFAVFNVADASISSGVVLLIVGMYLKERQAAAQTAAAQTTAAQAEAVFPPPDLAPADLSSVSSEDAAHE
jgi:signal peptidase II